MNPASVGCYFLLVLIPQTLWFLLSSNQKLSVFCESCSFFPPSEISPRVQTKASSTHGNPESPECHGNTATESGVDNLTARLCSCDIKEPDFKNQNGVSKDEETFQRNWIERDDGLGGWGVAHCLPDLSGPCTIKRRDTSLTHKQFLMEFAYTEPVILTGMSSQDAFRAHSTKYMLLKDYGQELITVATANTHSYRKVQMTLCDYVAQVMKPQSYDGLGNETLYHFGDNDRERWDGLFSLYQLPPLSLPNKEPVLSFGLAGPGSGVPFHVHGPTYAETIYGRKRWFLYPPSHSPLFHPDETTLRWYSHTYSSLPEVDKPLECTLNPGEILYLPDRWWHSTLNVDSVVFMSVFYS